VTDSGTLLTLRVPLAEFKTGIDLRDHHMQKYLDVEHHRDAILTAPKAALQIPAQGSTQAAVKGRLTLHGTTRDVNFKYKAQRAADGIRIEGTMQVDIREYGIEVPSYLGVTVKPNVDVLANFVIQDS
jgi:polyisoprenoid-binding protein YceI